MSVVYLNGQYLPRQEAKISVDDRGFVFGDGIYEVVRVVKGRIFNWEGHASRMADGLAVLRIDRAGSDPHTLRSVCEKLIHDNGLADGEASVYLQVTRGEAPRTHHFPPAGTAPTVFASASPFKVNEEMRKKGANGITMPDIRWARCDLKTVNLLGSVLTRQATVEAGAYEAILHRDGMITEGGVTNIFLVKDGVLRTYPLSNYILPGITRGVVLEIAKELGIVVEESPVAIQDVYNVDEIFACGTTTDVQPLVKIDGVKIGDGTPGPVSRRIQEAFVARLYSA